jgi:hypothetical protein
MLRLHKDCAAEQIEKFAGDKPTKVRRQPRVWRKQLPRL